MKPITTPLDTAAAHVEGLPTMQPPASPGMPDDPLAAATLESLRSGTPFFFALSSSFLWVGPFTFGDALIQADGQPPHGFTYYETSARGGQMRYQPLTDGMRFGVDPAQVLNAATPAATPPPAWGERLTGENPARQLAIARVRFFHKHGMTPPAVKLSLAADEILTDAGLVDEGIHRDLRTVMRMVHGATIFPAEGDEALFEFPEPLPQRAKFEIREPRGERMARAVDVALSETEYQAKKHGDHAHSVAEWLLLLQHYAEYAPKSDTMRRNLLSGIMAAVGLGAFLPPPPRRELFHTLTLQRQPTHGNTIMGGARRVVFVDPELAAEGWPGHLKVPIGADVDATAANLAHFTGWRMREGRTFEVPVEQAVTLAPIEPVPFLWDSPPCEHHYLDGVGTHRRNAALQGLRRAPEALESVAAHALEAGHALETLKEAAALDAFPPATAPSLWAMVTGENARTARAELKRSACGPKPPPFKVWEVAEISRCNTVINRFARLPGLKPAHAIAARDRLFDIIAGVAFSPGELRLQVRRNRLHTAQNRLKHSRHKSHRRTEKGKAYGAAAAKLTGRLEGRHCHES